METLKHPYIKYNFFYSAFTKSGKNYFIFLFSLLVFAIGLMLYNGLVPWAWFDALIPSIDSVAQEVVLERVSHNYRTIDLLGKAFSNISTYKSAYISVNPILIYIYGLFIIVGWSVILAAISKMEGILAYFFYFLFCCYIYFAEFGKIFIGNDTALYKAVALVLMLLFLLISQYFKQRNQPISLPTQFGIYAGLLSLLHIAVLSIGGLPDLHRAVTFGLPVFSIITILFIFIVSKDIPGLVLYLCNNNSTYQNQKSLSIYSIFSGLWIMISAIPLLSYYFPEVFGQSFEEILPICFMGLATVLNVFLAQNAYHQHKNNIQHNLAYTTLLLALGIISAGTLAYLFGVGEIGVFKAFNFIASILFFCTALFYYIYVIVNFYPEIQQKISIYYVLFLPKRVKFLFVWFMVGGIAIFLEANNFWRSYYQMTATYHTMAADQATLRQNVNDTRIWLGKAISYFQNEPKANYNLACIESSNTALLADADNVTNIKQLFSRAAQALELSGLAYGNFLVSIHQPKVAQAFYLKKLKEKPSLHYYVNLASIYLNQNQTDSCIITLKQGLTHFPKSGILYSNLAAVYARNKKYDWADKFIQAAIDYAPKNEAVLENFVYIKLLDKDKNALALDESMFTNSNSLGLQHNGAIWAYNNQKMQLADKLCNEVLAKHESTEALLLKMITQAAVDSFSNAQSRATWLNVQFPEFKPIVNHNLGTVYFKNGVPEMAAYYFTNAETPQDKLLAAQMEIDAGNHEKAYELLSIIRVDYPELANTALHELELLDFAHGNETAGLQWNFNDITFEEAMRAGFYGAQADNLNPAARFYQPLVDNDKKTTLPYLEIGRHYLAVGDPAGALIQFDAGLPRDPQNFDLNLEKARALYRANKKAEAQTIINQLGKKLPQHTELLFLKAEIAQTEGKYKDAISLLKPLNEKNRFDKRFALALAQCYGIINENELAYGVISQAVKVNNRNPDIWRSFGEFAFKNSMFEDAEFGYENAITFATKKEQKELLNKELNAIRKQILNQNAE